MEAAEVAGEMAATELACPASTFCQQYDWKLQPVHENRQKVNLLSKSRVKKRFIRLKRALG